MKTKNDGVCPICDKVLKGVAKHLKTWHKVENVAERAILNQIATGRVNLGSGPCPVPGCQSKFCPRLERHIRSHRHEMTAAGLQRILEAAKRTAALQRLRDLRATKPNPPLKSILDLEEEESEEEEREQEEREKQVKGGAGQTPLCQLPACQSLRRRVQELEKEVEELRASNAALRAAAAGEGPSGLQRPVAPPTRLQEDEEATKRGLAEIVSNLSDGDTSEDEEDSSKEVS
ncbi:uncharacterized protein LOC131967752 [Centropristis striata]|uniref:uncharacterized protein LOC131967752 n=1 Tax=Centropristis striata TaxID=184440 RepID=UPI0027E16274|nr:uncharacterized protein LOC131967752 [Centropristis striata]